MCLNTGGVFRAVFPGYTAGMPDSSVIDRSPGILGGIPVFRGTRVPIGTLLEYLEAGQRLEEFLQDFPTVTREQTVAALELAREALTSDASPDR